MKNKPKTMRKGIPNNILTREELNSFLRNQRKHQYLPGSKEYSAFRTLKILNKHGFNLENHIKKMLSKNKQIKILNSGAGEMLIDKELKKIFKDKIRITALTLAHPNISDIRLKKILNEIRKIKETELKDHPKKDELVNNFVKAHKKRLLEARENSKIVDEIKIRMIETFNTRSKFDLIIDWESALLHSPFKEQVFKKYLNILKNEGQLITSRNPKEILEGITTISKINNKYSFKIKKITGTNVFILTKIKK